MSQLQDDLGRRIADRLFLWVKDSAALYEMAGIPQHEAMCDIFCILVKLVCTGASVFNIPTDRLTEIMALMAREIEFKRRKGESNE